LEVKKQTSDIDKTLKDLYTSAKEFGDKLSVAKEMVKVEIARLKGDPQDPNDIPTGLKD
jgi:hypothetical protein